LWHAAYKRQTVCCIRCVQPYVHSMSSPLSSVPEEGENTGDDYVPTGREQGQDHPESPDSLDPPEHTPKRNTSTKPSLADRSRLKETRSASQCIVTLEKEPSCSIEVCHIVPRGLTRESVSTSALCPDRDLTKFIAQSPGISLGHEEGSVQSQLSL
jgi:hypothetical protein